MKLLRQIFTGKKVFQNPKDHEVIARLIKYMTNKDDIILDSFAGSGTTAHAVLDSNNQQNSNRRFILVEMDEGIAQTVTAERIRRVSSGYTNAKGEMVKGLGGGFQFCRLSKEPLFQADGSIRSGVTFEELAEFVWLVETGTGFTPSTIRKRHKRTPFLGQYRERAVFLLFNGILTDKSDTGGNVLNSRTLNILREAHPGFQGQTVVYGARSRFDKVKLATLNIIFRQLPYDLASKTWL